MEQPRILGLALAGGQSRRMGADKAFIALGGRPLIAHAIARLRSQCAAVAISANGDAGRFAAFGAPVIADDVKDFAGPLAGVLAGLDHAARNGFDAIVTLPVDTPFAPHDLAVRLVAGRGQARIAAAASGGRTHHAVALWATALAGELRRALETEGERSVARFAARYNPAIVEWPTEALDPFFNVNAPADLVTAERALSG
ncbi:MAG: molybdenum cofactor guanylyltransferase MobA [Beijerinckiaceae bacterium]